MLKEKSKNSFTWFLAILLAVVVVYTIRQGSDVELTVSPKSGVTFSTHKGQSLTELIGGGLDALVDADGDTESELLEKEKGRKAMMNFFAGRDYYKLNGKQLSNAIRDMESDTDAAKRLRGVLYDLAGPFSRPGTFREADARLWGAFEDLHTGLRAQSNNKGNLFAEAYKQMLNADNVLGATKNPINAEVRLIKGDSKNSKAIFSCPGSDLKQGVFASIRGIEQAAGGMETELIQNFQFFQCKNMVAASDFLKGDSVQVGVSQEAFDIIYPPDRAELSTIREAGIGAARIILYPANLGPRIVSKQ